MEVGLKVCVFGSGCKQWGVIETSLRCVAVKGCGSGLGPANDRYD